MNSKICGLTVCLKRNSSSYQSKSSHIPHMPPTHQPTQIFVVFKWLMAYFKLCSNSGIHGYYILRCFVGHISPHHSVPHSLFAGYLHDSNLTRPRCPAQLSVACSTASDGKLGGAWVQAMESWAGPGSEANSNCMIDTFCMTGPINWSLLHTSTHAYVLRVDLFFLYKTFSPNGKRLRGAFCNCRDYPLISVHDDHNKNDVIVHSW